MVDLAVAVFERHPRHRVCVLIRDHRVAILAADLHARTHTREGSVSEGHRRRKDPRPSCMARPCISAPAHPRRRRPMRARARCPAHRAPCVSQRVGERVSACAGACVGECEQPSGIARPDDGAHAHELATLSFATSIVLNERAASVALSAISAQRELRSTYGVYAQALMCRSEVRARRMTRARRSWAGEMWRWWSGVAHGGVPSPGGMS